MEKEIKTKHKEIIEKPDGFFLDTNVFESANFNLIKPNITKFFELCESHKINIYIDNTVKQEIKNRILKKSNEITKSIKQTKFLPYICNMLEIKSSQEEFETKIINYLNNKIEEILKQIKVIDNNINTNELLTLYFKEEAPFNVDNKKCEFPDAIIMLSLKQYLDKENKNIIVISNDNGIKKYCLNNDIKCINYISGGVNIIYSYIEKYIFNFFEDEKEKIKLKINNYIKEELDFTIYGYGPFYDDIEVETYEIEKLSIENINITDVNKEENSFTITCYPKITFIIYTYPYPDLERAAHDSEDDEWYVFGKLKTTFYLTKELELNFEINIINKTSKDFEINFIDNEPEIDFNIYDVFSEDIVEQKHIDDDSIQIYK
jgi:hypothetical protein